MKQEWRNRLARELSLEALHDQGVQAARTACVAGASVGAAAIAAAAYYDNPQTGMPAVGQLMERIRDLPLNREAWRRALARVQVAGTAEQMFAPGFGFVNPDETSAVLGALRRLIAPWEPTPRVRSVFFLAHVAAITQVSGPLNVAGLCALIFVDHDLTIEEAEWLYLVLRIEPAVKAAQRVRRAVSSFPGSDEPPPRSHEVTRLMKEAGVAG